MRTSAFVLSASGEASKAFTFQQIELDSLLPDEVLIESEAFGLNYADVMARMGLYKDAPPMPCVLGYEIVGLIKEVGASVDKNWLGRRVLAFTRFGGYAKHAKTKLSALVEINDLPAHIALPFATQGVTAHYMAEVLSPIQTSDKVLVHAAAGGVGSFLVQLAKLKGATVYGKVGNDAKLEYVHSLGADVLINYKKEDYQKYVATHLAGLKLTASFNAVGGSSVKKDLQLLGPGGRLFLFGGADLGARKGLLGKISFLWEMGIFLPIGLMMQSKSLLGINMLKLGDQQPLLIQNSMRSMLDLYKSDLIKAPKSEAYSYKELAHAHHVLGSGDSEGKIIINWS